MKSSLIILALFLTGLLTSYYRLLPRLLTETDFTLYALYGLLFLVGIGIGSNTATWHVLRQTNLKILLIPLSAMVGTWLGVSVVYRFLPGLKWGEAMAVGSGFGYYSLSSVIISQIHSETLGVVALLSNVLREMLTLLLTPLMVRYGGKLAPIAAGGATAIDTTLPIITRFTGSEYAIMAIFSGLVLTVVVPFLVTFFLGLAK